MQSGAKSNTKNVELIEAQVSRLEASPATPRRRWSAAAKERIVIAAMAPGANVSAIARNNGLSPQQVFAWRRKAAGPKHLTAAPSFAMVAIDPGEAGGVVELDTSGNWRAGTNYDSLTRVVGGFWDARAAGFLGRRRSAERAVG